jgi:hypothetical protein
MDRVVVSAQRDMKTLHIVPRSLAITLITATAMLTGFGVAFCLVVDVPVIPPSVDPLEANVLMATRITPRAPEYPVPTRNTALAMPSLSVVSLSGHVNVPVLKVLQAPPASCAPRSMKIIQDVTITLPDVPSTTTAFGMQRA